jgi:hypothetical protein
MELTKEHFDQVVSGLATKKQVADVSEQIEDLARITSRGFEDVMERLDVRTRVEKVEAKLQKIGDALHLEL